MSIQNLLCLVLCTVAVLGATVISLLLQTENRKIISFLAKLAKRIFSFIFAFISYGFGLVALLVSVVAFYSGVLLIKHGFLHHLYLFAAIAYITYVGSVVIMSIACIVYRVLLIVTPKSAIGVSVIILFLASVAGTLWALVYPHYSLGNAIAKFILDMRLHNPIVAWLGIVACISMVYFTVYSISEIISESGEGNSYFKPEEGV